MSSAEAKVCLNSNRWKVEETVQVLAARPPKPTSTPIGKIFLFDYVTVCMPNKIFWVIVQIQRNSR